MYLCGIKPNFDHMKKGIINKIATYCLLVTSLAFGITACKNDDEPVPAEPEVTAVSSSLQQQPGQAISVGANIFAPAGIKSVSVTEGQTEVATKTDFAAGDQNELYSFDYTVPVAAAEGSTINLTITATDLRDRIATTTVTITVSQVPAQIIEVSSAAGGVGTTTWLARNTYVLNGFIYVNDGQTLTIEPGTVIKGRSGTGASASALIVARGGKIIAKGTAENPIIFTSLADDVSRTNDLAVNTRGLWGGLIILGKAPINHAATQTLIEGLPSTETRGIYGGTDANDNSGELSYVSIRHGGSNIGADNEINGLTMGGVGRGTKIDHIEVWGNDDDGFEWFGGSVNTSYIASLYNQDDAFDWDQGFISQNQFWVGFQEPKFTRSGRGMELDGAHSGNLAAPVYSKPTIYNMTLIGQGNAGGDVSENAAIFMTEGSGGYFYNSIITGFSAGINLNNKGATGNTTLDRLTNGDLVFANNLWWNIGADNSITTISGANAALAAHLTTNANVIDQNPQLAGIAADNFNPLPAAGSAALTAARKPLPAAPVDNFTYTAADYMGAFGTTNWLKGGWTAAEAYGILK